MMLPKKVKINDMDYSVEEVPDLYREEDDAFLYGHITHTERQIEINKNMDSYVKVQALTHEILHAIFHQCGQIAIDDEELIVAMLGCQLPKLLRDNPELVQALLSDPNGADDAA